MRRKIPASPRKLPSRAKPVLIVQHAPHEHPAVVRRALETQGIPSLWVHPYAGEGYPEASEISGMISLGGPMSVNDEADHPWILEECRLMKAVARKALPMVGICLGGQLIAKALGGRVERNPHVEVGWFPIDLNGEGRKDAIVGAAGVRPTVYHWHGDTFHLPAEAELLATSLHCERQAYRIGDRIYGFQFHPEADHQLVHEWLAIEGVEQEIADTLQAHGARTVQDASTQRSHAFRGEKASLKITAAIGSLFSRKREPESAENLLSRRQLQGWAVEGTLLDLSFTGSAGQVARIRGRANAVLRIPAGEFLILQDETTLLWPIRLEDIVSISPVS